MREIMFINEKTDRPWYTECTDLCGYCFRHPLMKMNTYSAEFHFHCRSNKCTNQSDPNTNIALAICDWNIKQRKIRGKI